MPTEPLGRVAAPPEHESTSGKFFFWVDKKKSVERTQIVTTKSSVGGREVSFVGIVQEVYRRSRQKDVGEEAARFDGNSTARPPFDSEGVTFAEVAILRTEPVAHTPPTEESEVFLGDQAAAEKGYGLDKMGQRFDIGLLRNGGTEFAGKAAIDLDFLLGKNGGHLNVNGIAGLGTKSTLLMTMNWLLLREAAKQKLQRTSDPNRLQVVPVIFNVKNFDLFFIDRWNKDFRTKEAENRDEWRRSGVDCPTPFERPTFFAPQAKGLQIPVRTGGRVLGAESAYSWSLADVIERGIFSYLFSDEDNQDANFGGLVMSLEEWLIDDFDGKVKLQSNKPQTFKHLLEEFRDNYRGKDFFPEYHIGTKGKLYRKLKFIVDKGDGVLRKDEPKGNPLKIPATGQDSPIVIDLYGLHATPSLQRFVVAAVFHQIQQAQSEKQVPNLKYLITLDELNRFAPKDSSDPITQKLETVASEGRSQGIILFGAQQQASLVKPRVIENAAVRAIGRSGTLELGAEVWKFLNKSARDAASQLQQEEKLIYIPSFREPMLAKIPFPPFALSEGDAESAASTVGGPRPEYRIPETDAF